MTEPAIDPTPAPATEPTGATSETDLAARLKTLEAERDQWKGHARDWEGKAKANKQDADAAAKRDAAIAKIAQELGLDTGTKPDPEAIARELAATKTTAQRHATEVAVLRAAQSLGADGDALLDSQRFLNSIAEVNPADSDAVKAAITAAMTGNPKFAATAPAPAAPAPPQASTAGGFDASPGAARQLTAADIDRMSPAQVAKAHKAGLTRDYLNS